MHVQQRIIFNRDLLKKIRKEQNLKQSELANMLNTKANVVSYWETGRRTPLPPTVDQMVKVTGYPHEDFYEINYETLGTRLTTIRLRKDLSQQKVAESIHSTIDNMARWEADKHLPSAYYTFKLAEAYELTMEELLANEDLPKDILELETMIKINKKDLNTLDVRTFGEKIKALRELKGINQRNLAEIIDTPTENLNRWEANRHIPYIYHVYKIAKIFGLTMEDLITNREGKLLLEDPYAFEILDEQIIEPENVQ